MSWKSLLVLLVLVAGLLYLNSQKGLREQEALSQVDAEYTLFPGFQPQLVSELRIDNVERAYQIKFERDGQGLWYLTDPVPYPATGAIVSSVLNAIHSGLAQPVENTDLASMGLELPKVVVHIEQVLDGSTQSFRLDLGDPELNQDRIFARAQEGADGQPQVVSVTRAIYNALVRFPNDYRDPSVWQISPANVISFKRQGRVWNERLQRELDLGFEMQKDGAQWQRVDAPEMSLNPQIAGFLVNSAAHLKVGHFEQDMPPSLANFGLEQPAFQIELTTGDESPQTLAFGHPAAASGAEIVDWFFHRVGFPHVWSIEAEAVRMLVTPAEDLYNPYLVQALRDEIHKLELKLGENQVLLEREKVLQEDRWFMTLRAPEQAERRFPVDLGPVKDLLAKLEGAEISYGEALDFEPSQRIGSISIHVSDGLIFGGELGERWKDSERGLVGYRYRRFGDQLPGLLDESLSELFVPGGIDPADFRPPNIHSIRWADARRISLSYQDKEFIYTHSADDKRWTVDPGENKRKLDAPKAFSESVLSLLSLFAEEWLDEFDPEELSERLEVIVYDALGNGLSFVLGRDAAGRLICLEDGSAALVSLERMRIFEESYQRPLLEGLIELFQDE